MKADQSLNCTGLYCPIPIVKTAVKIKELKTGEVLEVVTDDKRARLDLLKWCRTTKHEFLGVEENAGEIKVYIKKTHD